MTPFPLSPHDAATRWRVLCAGVCALVLTLGLARFAYTPLLPIMRAQADLSLLAGGWLAAINYAGYMSGVLLATAVSDVERKFRLYRIGLLLAGLPALSIRRDRSAYSFGVKITSCPSIHTWRRPIFSVRLLTMSSLSP
mgnify:CR=1 FL=1